LRIEKMVHPIEFFAEVKIHSNDAALSELDGAIGVVLGRSQNEETGAWGYAVYIEGHDDVWDVPSEALQPTGRMRSREDFYDGTSLKVRVDPRSGEGGRE
jgi:hypothetical protein